SVRFLHGADPATVEVTHPVFQLLDRAFKDVVGRGTVPARAGGSIPVVPALGKGGAPVILTGIGLPDDRLHAPNEKLDLKQLWDGIKVFRRFYELLGANRVQQQRFTTPFHDTVALRRGRRFRATPLCYVFVRRLS